MKFSFTKVLILVQTVVILIMFVILVLIPKKDNTEALIEQHEKMWQQTQEKVQASYLEIVKSSMKIDSLDRTIADLGEKETMQQESLDGLIKNVNKIKYEIPRINFRDSSNSTTSKFLSDRISGNNNK